MILERIESKGLAHYSYLIGDENEAVVIDPRRDIEIYLELAKEAGMHITKVLETHRNEDYLIGSKEFLERTNAEAFHSDYEDYDFGYGQTIKDGDVINFGSLTIKALHTPGHTKGHMSYLLYDADKNPWIIFTGDLLFAGDVGRTDFYQDEFEEMTGSLYDSIYEKVLPLGNGVIICPAHGAGSVCGSSITERIWTTIGLERKYNPALQTANRKEFIEKYSKSLPYPPYFKEMEKGNKIGPSVDCDWQYPQPLSPQKLLELAGDTQIVDIRSETAYSAAHLPDSIYIAEDLISNFAGWFLNYDQPILLVSDTSNVDDAAKQLFRMGYDNIIGYLKGGITSAAKAGIDSNSIRTVNGSYIKKLHENGVNPYILDIRGEEEAKNVTIPSSIRTDLTDLPDKFNKIPEDEEIYIFCGSGIRSMLAASLLEKSGYEKLNVVLGGTSGWEAN